MILSSINVHWSFNRLLMEKREIFFTRRATLVALLCLVAFVCFSQTPPGIKEFGEATREVERNYKALTRLIAPIGAIFGLVGGIRVYNNWQCGKHHIDAQVMGWLGACIFSQLIAVIIAALY